MCLACSLCLAIPDVRVSLQKMSTEIDLLGEPRVKNGLTYYPGVQTEKGSVMLGNVVRLQLQAEGARLPTSDATLFAFSHEPPVDCPLTSTNALSATISTHKPRD